MPILENRTIAPELVGVIQKQRQEILCGIQEAKEKQVEYRVIEAYRPTIEKYAHIHAITYDGAPYQGGKTKVYAYLGFPKGASADKKVPAVVLVHGGCGHPYLEWVRLWNERGYAAIAMETTGYFPEEVNAGVNEAHFAYDFGDFAEEGYVLAPKCGNPTEVTPVQNQWNYQALIQITLAGNILRQDERVEESQIGITGISWGGTLITQLIGLDPRYAFAIPVYGTAYLSASECPFENYNLPYIRDLWGAEQDLDNATMPIMWYVYNDDGGFGFPNYNKTYQQTASLNEKNVLFVRHDWGHGHAFVFNEKETENHSKVFADWVIYQKGGYPTFVTQPRGREFRAEIFVPKDIEGEITATIYYLTEPMSYRVFRKFGGSESYFLEQNWQKCSNGIQVDRENGLVFGQSPKDAAGYYIDLTWEMDGMECQSSSMYIPIND